MQGLSESVVVEPYQASSECVEFSVTVLGSSKGPVVLLPTEVESYDMEDDLFEAALDFEVYKARREVASSSCCSSSSSSLSSPRCLADVAAALLHLCRPSLCQCGNSSSASLLSPPRFADVAALLLPFLSSCPAPAFCPASSARSSSFCSSSCFSSSCYSVIQALCLHTAWYRLCPTLVSNTM